MFERVCILENMTECFKNVNGLGQEYLNSNILITISCQNSDKIQYLAIYSAMG